MDPRERDVLMAAQAGDARAVESLLSSHTPQVARFAARMCRNTADAEEVVQETLIAAARTLPNFRGDASLTTWLYTIARSFCIKQRRRGRTVRRADASLDDPLSPASAQLADDRPRPDARLADRELGEAIEDALDHLAPMYREVLILRDMEGLSAPEVAQTLGLGLEAVKSRLHRARLSVRAALAPVLEEPETPAVEGTGACPDVLGIYSRHLEGDIRAETCAAMEAHLAECQHCRGRCDSLRRTLHLCRMSPGPAVSPSTQQMVRVAIQRAMMRG